MRPQAMYNLQNNAGGASNPLKGISVDLACADKTVI